MGRQLQTLTAWAFAISFAVALTATSPASAHIPRDPGKSGKPGGWQLDQWNFLAPPSWGVNAPRAWDNLIAAGRPGGRGVTVAVLDTGLAYDDRGPFERSLDVSRFRLARGHDFCSRASIEEKCVGIDRYPNDENGHGTHVAGTIGEATNNAVGETGLAYEAKIMPVKITNKFGGSEPRAMARGIRYAAHHGAHVINISAGFPEFTRREIPELANAVRDAQVDGVLIVASVGNNAGGVALPASLPGVIAVGATTANGCLAAYSNHGSRVDLVAPGGGQDKRLPGCLQTAPPWRNILQMTFTPKKSTIRIPNYYYGTSMAAPHVSATAALIIASGVLGPRPSPAAILRRLKATARDLGPAGEDAYYGAGLVDAGAATTRQ